MKFVIVCALLSVFVRGLVMMCTCLAPVQIAALCGISVAMDPDLCFCVPIVERERVHEDGDSHTMRQRGNSPSRLISLGNVMHFLHEPTTNVAVGTV